MEHKHYKVNGVTDDLAFPDCPACAVEKYRKDVLEKIKAKKLEYSYADPRTELAVTYLFVLTALDELIKEMEAEK